MNKKRKYIKGGGVDDTKIVKPTHEQLAMEAAGFKYPDDIAKWKEAGMPDPRSKLGVRKKPQANKKYFIGGLLKGIAGGPLGMIRALKDKKKEGVSGKVIKQGGGNGAHTHNHEGDKQGKALTDKVNGSVEGTSESDEKIAAGVMKKGGVVYKKGGTLEDDFKYASGIVDGDNDGERKIKNTLKTNEAKMYKKINRKPPIRNIFKNGGVLVKKKKKDKKFVILNTQEEIDKINKDAAGLRPGARTLPNFKKKMSRRYVEGGINAKIINTKEEIDKLNKDYDEEMDRQFPPDTRTDEEREKDRRERIKNEYIKQKKKKGRIIKKRKYVEGGEVKEDYSQWKDKKGKNTVNISPTVDRKQHISKYTEETLDPDSKKADIKSAYITNKNQRGGLEHGNQDTLLEAKNNQQDIKKKGLLRGVVNRKTEKGLVKKKYDDELYETSNVVAGARADKFDLSQEKEEKDLGREQRKYVQHGMDEEGDPTKTKIKIKGVGGRDIPTIKEKEKQLNATDADGNPLRKYVTTVDGKRVKKRGGNDQEAREYKRRGFRRRYTDPDSEGNYQYLNSNKRATRLANKEENRLQKKTRKQENKAIREQRRESNRANKKQERQDFKSNFAVPTNQSYSSRQYKKGGTLTKRPPRRVRKCI